MTDSEIRLLSRVIDVPRRTVLRLNAQLGRYRDVIWLIGDARSGTTWVSDLVNHHHRYRDMFEPIRPARVDAVDFLRPHQYVRPGTDFPQLLEVTDEIFSGRFTHPRVDGANVRPLYRGLLVKDCFANLLAGWACREHTHVRPILLIRNPFAVALSKRKKPRWYWPTDPAELVAQSDLVDDHLGPYVDVIDRVVAEGDDLQCMLATWAVINLVPLRQFGVDALHVCFYERMYADPEGELGRLYEFVAPPDRRPRIALSRDAIDRPSRMAGDRSNLGSHASPVTAWKRELAADQIDRGLALLGEFGLGDLYGDDSMPDSTVIERFRPDGGDQARPEPGTG